MRVAVVGASGFIGGALARALIARGDTVIALTRRGASGVEGAHEVRWDPAQGPPPPEALIEVDAVVNLAGASIGGRRWTDARKREIVESRTVTTRLLVDALAAPGAPRVLVNGSAVGYYGPTEHEVDETAAPGDDFPAHTSVVWEAEARRAEEHGVRVVLLRTGIVLERTGGALPQMALPVRFFAGGPLGGGRQWLSWIHLADEIGIILWALDGDVAGPLNATAPDPARQRDFVRALGRALGRPAFLPTPAFPLRLAMGEMATIALDGQRAVPAVAHAGGYVFRHPDLDDALAAIYS